MNKVWLIIQREYITRVKKKSFLVTTLLIPILMLGLIATMAYMAAKSEQKETIAVIDESGIFIHKMDTSSSAYSIVYVNNSARENHMEVLEKTNVISCFISILS
ncbi:hypothetical protein EMGBS15_13840 [Filimonas sp.]|nr:hypothetical protein EMGBS15_13840 [Filimonas sp.]